MTRTLLQIWQHFQESFSVEPNMEKPVDSGETVLAATLEINEDNFSLKAVKNLLQYSSSLLDVLYLPLAQILQQELSFVSLSVNFLNLYVETTQECPSLEESVLIISQGAYLQSIKEILSLYPLINWDAYPENIQEFSKKLPIIQHIELDEETATNTIVCFQESELAKAFNQIFISRLISPSVTKFLGNLLTQRIAANTHHHIINALPIAAEPIQKLINNYWSQWSQEQEIIQNVDHYLQTEIASKPLETFFDQSYSCKDIYFPLKAKTLDKNSHTLDLETWVKGMLLNQQRLEKVMLIKGEQGSGKSVFCIMFADWVKQHLHPLWTPLLINLRNLHKLGDSLAETLERELQLGLMDAHHDLLIHKNTKFLLILDGLDDLNIDLEAFIKQVVAFQENCKNPEGRGHRVIITSRTNTLKYIANLPYNFEQVEILDLDQALQEKWLKKWALLPDNKGQKTNLKEYLFSKKCPSSINKLVAKPLYLHLLALMYRDDTLNLNNLEKANQKTAQVVIFQELVNWLIAKHPPILDNGDVNDQENQDYQLNIYQSTVKNLLTETAVVIVQSGGVFGSIPMIQSRLQEKQTDIITTLNKFYFSAVQKQADQQVDKIECFHKTFSDFLFAKKLTQSLQEWSRLETEEEIQTMNWQIYDLLGFGKITPEIVDYVMGLLMQIPDLYWINLFKVLDNFYHNWYQGKFIDTAELTLAQKKSQQLQQDSRNDGEQNLGQRQIDIYAGLNVMILLLEIQHYAQEHDVLKEYIIFYPSGETQGDHLTADLLRIINYCNCLQGDSFKSIVGQFFSATHLRATYLFQADLSGMDLNQADLSRAELSRSYLWHTNLSNAYLIAAKLTQADLRGANLSSVNMIGTDLRGADLSHANLQDADLSRVDLSGANLKGANLQGAYMIGATFGDEEFGYVRWDKKTNFEDVEGLEAAKNVPAALRKQLGLE